MSEIKFIVWTDASSIINNGIDETSTGYVIKDGKMPPFCGSKIYSGIGNSKGELKAGIESLETLAEYCNCIPGIDTKNCIVELRTDFHELKKSIDKRKIRKTEEPKKKRIFRELKKLQRRFKYVDCKEIYRSDNIAHNVCYFQISNRGNGIVKSFSELYENPENCKIKTKQD